MSDGETSIEPLAEHHREALRAACAEDAEIWQIYPVNFSGKDFNGNFDACLGQPDQAAFAILTGKQLVGMSSYLGINRENRVLEIGRTYIAPRVRGTGLNARVKRLMLTRAFAEGFTRVDFRIDTRNGRSMAAVEKLGAVRTGTLRRNRITWTGFVRDTAVYSVLADEWRDRPGG
ncbi:MAG: GNAT family N-acetyltransferase [Pseudomonadota bacterium]|nr:GNAT family N-acetyltransferase [Pseudomonadota bacterium]